MTFEEFAKRFWKDVNDDLKGLVRRMPDEAQELIRELGDWLSDLPEAEEEE